MEQRGHLPQEQVVGALTATQDEEQGKDPSSHEPATVMRSMEEASSTGRAVVTCEAEHATSRSATCKVEERAPPA